VLKTFFDKRTVTKKGEARLWVDQDRHRESPNLPDPSRSLSQTERTRTSAPQQHSATLNHTDSAHEHRNAQHIRQFVLKLQSGILTALLHNQISHGRHQEETKLHSFFISQRIGPLTTQTPIPPLLQNLLTLWHLSSTLTKHPQVRR
jgi:hypothetical protein